MPSQKGHMKKPAESSEKYVRYTCDQCDYSAAQKDCIQRYMETVHEKMHYNCYQCNYKST